MQLDPRNTNFSTPVRYAESMTLSWISRLSRMNSRGTRIVGVNPADPRRGHDDRLRARSVEESANRRLLGQIELLRESAAADSS